MGIQWKHASAESPKWECYIGEFIKLQGEFVLHEDVIDMVEKAAWQRCMAAMDAPASAFIRHPSTGEDVPIGKVKADLLAHRPTPEILKSIGWT